MGEIQANILAAQSVAAEMSLASNTIASQSFTISKAEKTTVAGNENAGSTLEQGS